MSYFKERTKNLIARAFAAGPTAGDFVASALAVLRRCRTRLRSFSAGR